MTNSPPSKLQLVDVSARNIKACGIDTLVISIYGEWKNLEWFSYFAELKKLAQESSNEVNGLIQTDSKWTFRIKPNGTEGFEWLLSSNDFTLKIGKWANIKTRPNVMAQIRSEMLWRIGARESSSYILNMLSEMGFEIKEVKPSRVDLCLDMLFPKSAWNNELIEYAMTKATSRALYIQKAGIPTGFAFGRGDLSARLYDKALEIVQKSHKFWMYDIWGLDEIPPKEIMLRVEFQIRREPLKELGIKTLSDLHKKQQNLWAYCTKKWLIFKDNLTAYRRKRKVLPWWMVVQGGYIQAQGASPAIREKIIKWNMEQLSRQGYGILLSMMACNLELLNAKNDPIKLEHVLFTLIDWMNKIGKTSNDMNAKIVERRAKFKRTQEGGE